MHEKKYLTTDVSGAKDTGIGLKCCPGTLHEWDVRSGIQQIFERAYFNHALLTPLAVEMAKQVTLGTGQVRWTSVY